MLFITPSGIIVSPRPYTPSTIYPAKLSAANALPRKPDRVMAIWMVDRNAEGVSTIFRSRFARLSPSSSIFFSFVAFRDTTAISVAAKNAFSPIRTTCNNSLPTIEPTKFTLLFSFRSGFHAGSSQHSCSLSVTRRMSACLCRQACPSTRPPSGFIAQKGIACRPSGQADHASVCSVYHVMMVRFPVRVRVAHENLSSLNAVRLPRPFRALCAEQSVKQVSFTL